LDTQGTLAVQLGVRLGLSLRHLLLHQAQASQCIVGARERLDLIPSDASLLEVEGALWREPNKERAYRFLVNQLGGIENGYDFVLLDFPPSPNLLSECALYYVEEIIVPVAMNYMALLGIRKVIETLRAAQCAGSPARLAWILPTFFNPRLKLDNEVIGILQRYFPAQVAEPIRLNVHLAQAPGHHKTIYEYAPTSTGALDYARFVEKVCGNG
jgi:chromosome partitioning protein